MQYANNLKLYRVKGFFVSEFYLLASSKKEARKEAKKNPYPFESRRLLSYKKKKQLSGK